MVKPGLRNVRIAALDLLEVDCQPDAKFVASKVIHMLIPSPASLLTPRTERNLAETAAESTFSGWSCMFHPGEPIVA